MFESGMLDLLKSRNKNIDIRMFGSIIRITDTLPDIFFANRKMEDVLNLISHLKASEIEKHKSIDTKTDCIKIEIKYVYDKEFILLYMMSTKQDITIQCRHSDFLNKLKKLLDTKYEFLNEKINKKKSKKLDI